MSYKATNWARVQRIHRTPRTVLVYLSERANEREGYYCFPGQQMIADATGLSAKTVWSSLKYLEEMGFITRERRNRKMNGRRTSDAITLIVSDSPIETVPYGQWLKGGLLVSDAGSTRNTCEAVKEREHPVEARASRELEAREHVSTSSTMSALDERMHIAVVNEITNRVPGVDNETLWSWYGKTVLVDLNILSLTPAARAATERLHEALSQEIARRFGGVS